MNKIRELLEMGVTPSTYIITGTSGNAGILSFMTGDPSLMVVGSILIIAALIATAAYLKKSITWAQIGSMGSFSAWLYVCLYIITSGQAASLIILGIPNVLLFGYFYIAAGTLRFWGCGLDSARS